MWIRILWQAASSDLDHKQWKQICGIVSCGVKGHCPIAAVAASGEAARTLAMHFTWQRGSVAYKVLYCYV